MKVLFVFPLKGKMMSVVLSSDGHDGLKLTCTKKRALRTRCFEVSHLENICSVLMRLFQIVKKKKKDWREDRENTIRVDSPMIGVVISKLSELMT